MDPAKQPGIRFVRVHLVSLRFAVKGVVPAPIKTAIGIGIDRQLSEDRKALDVLITVDLFKNLAKEDRPPIDFEFTLAGRFEVGENPNMPLDEFAKEHAPAHLFPFIRELITNITARSPLPVLNLGPINVLALLQTGQAKLEFSSPPKQESNLE